MSEYILFLTGFIILIKGADWLVKGASDLAGRFHVSPLVIGLTVVAFGTSLPELFVNLSASFQGSAQIAVGNILGSNIANIFLILGISALVYPLAVTRGTVWKEIPLCLLAALLLLIMGNDRRIDQAEVSLLSRIDGLILLCCFIVFLYYTVGIAGSIEGLKQYSTGQSHNLSGSLARIVGGLLGLSLGGKWIVGGAIHLAQSLKISETLIGLTVVAVGTSLPELATSVTAAYRKNVEIAVGNVIGSNIFNIFFILGISAIISPLPLPSRSNFDMTAALLGSLLLFVFMFTGRRHRLDRWEGIVFVVLYMIYIAVSI